MEVKNPLVFLNKKDSSITKTFITNLFIGLVAFALFSDIAAIASAEEVEVSEDPVVPAQVRETKMQEFKAQRENSQAEFDTRREEQKAALDERREAIASNTETMREQIMERKENVASRTEVVREKIQERKAVLSERIKNRILALAENVSRKMKAAIGRLTQIISRFETRIETLETKGVDGSAAQAKLDEATAHLARASSILENEVNANVDNTVGSEDPRTAWQTGKAKFTEAREAIRSAHQAIKEALDLLKEAVREANLENGVSNAVKENSESDSSEEDTASSTSETSN